MNNQYRNYNPNYQNYTRRPAQKQKANGFGVFLIVLGLLLECFAGGLWGYNQYIQAQAEAAASDALADYMNGGNNYDYFGAISIPSAKIELPVLNGWSDDLLHVGACVFDGTMQDDNLIIIGHNYKSVFGRLDWISVGDTVTLTVYGVEHNYTVSEVTEIDASNKHEMYSGNWDLTLYTCNYSGAGRITIRCVHA